MAFRWYADKGLTLNAGLVALWFIRGSGPVLLRNPIALCFSGGGGGGTDSCPPSGSAHVRNIAGSDDANVLTELSS